MIYVYRCKLCGEECVSETFPGCHRCEDGRHGFLEPLGYDSGPPRSPKGIGEPDS